MKVNDDVISSLLYADTLILMDENKPAELQTMTDKLVTWCDTWGMKINSEKWKVMYVRPTSYMVSEIHFTGGKKPLE